MKYYIAGFNRDWADEFNVIGSKIFTEDEKTAFEAGLVKYADNTVTIYFGTNEWWDEDPVSDFASSYKFTEISKTMYTEVNKKFRGEFGTFINVVEYAIEQDLDEDY